MDRKVTELAKSMEAALGNYAGQHFRVALLKGFLRGVADGSITVGQTWALELLIYLNEHDGGKAWTAEQMQVLQSAVAAGIFCDGQSLASQTRSR